MLNERVIPIDFGQGLDTKTDPKLVVAGKLLRLENAVCTAPKSWEKRNGYDALSNLIANGGTLQSPKMAHAYNDELLVADKNLLLSYSESQDAWVSRGNYTSTQLSRTTVDQEHSNSGFSDVAVLGNYALYGWSSAVQTNLALAFDKSISMGSVVDLQTGAVLANMPESVGTLHETYNSVRCVLLGGTTLAILYISPDFSQILLRTVIFSGGGVVSFSAPVSVTTLYAGQAFTIVAPQFDVIPTAGGATLVYFSTTGVTVSNLDATGAVTATVNTPDAGAFGPIFVSQNQFNNNLWVYWSNAALAGVTPTSLSLYYAVFSPALAPVLAKTLIGAQVAPYYVTNLISVSDSATQQTVYYGKYDATDVPFAGNTLYADGTRKVTVTSGGVVGLTSVFSFGVTPISRPFAVGPLNYAVFVYRSSVMDVSAAGYTAQTQPTYFLVKLSDTALSSALVVSRFGAGVANSQASLQAQIGFTPSVSALSASRFLYACGIETQEFNTDSFVSAQAFPGGLVGVFSYDIDFNGPDAYAATNAGDLAVLNGGLIQCYDGQTCAEFGYHLAPEIVQVAPAVVAGSLKTPGTYSVIAIYQWTDAQGNLHQSAPSLAKSITLVGGQNTIQTTVNYPFLTQKIKPNVAIYVTQDSGNVYFLATNPVFPLYNDPSATSVIYSDGFSDAQIAGNPQAYTSPASPVLENSTPPPSMAMVAHNNRLWFVDAENRDDVWYTKSFISGTGLSPSAFMLEQIDAKFGPIGALAEMDDKIVYLKESGLAASSGDGVDDTGSGNSLSFPQFIPSDVGCSEMKSVITFPMGVMFKSINGIYMMSRSLSVAYAGSEVEAYNGQRITSAKLVPTKSQIRFLCSTGNTIFYDYIFNQWGTFTNHTGLSSTAWKGLYVYITTGAEVFKETPGVYSDNGTAYAVLAQTSWLALGSVQGFQRVRRLEMLGDYVNGASAAHGVRVSAAYDFSSTPQPAVPYIFGSATSGAAFQYRERLPIQKCDSISLIIQEIITGDPAEYVRLSNMSFEAGVKKGLNKLAAGQSVG